MRWIAGLSRRRPPRQPRGGWVSRRMPGAFAALAVLAWPVRAQIPFNPVYVDDSPAARETLQRASELLRAGNVAETVRALQRLLDEAGDRVIQSPDDPDLFYSVRAAVHRAIVADAELLERYRELEEPLARSLLDADPGRVEQIRLLTASGYEAALRLAQVALEEARFEAARLILEQLESHPDRAGASGAEAAALLATVARYLDRPEVWERARAWTTESGGRWQDQAPVAWPEGSRQEQFSPVTTGQPLALDDLVAKPLHSVNVVRDVASTGRDSRNRRAETVLEFPWVLPAVAEEAVYVNDGVSFSAWDRFTLTPLWRTKPEWKVDNRATSQYNRDAAFWGDASRATTALVWGTSVIGATGRAPDVGRQGDGRIHSLDRRTGEVRWSWGPSSQGEAFQFAVPLAGSVVVEGTLVVPVEKQLFDERTWSTYLFGLSAADGSVRWRRPIASIGSQPFNPPTPRAAGILDHQGLVFRSDALGATAAIEAHSGRVAWIRRRPTPVFIAQESVPTGAMTYPVVDGSSLVLLTADANEIVRIDIATGRQLARRRAADFAWPRYILKAGDRLVAIGMRQVATVPLADYESAPIRVSAPFDSALPVGRAVASEREIFLPFEGGGLVLNAADPSVSRKVLLEHSGNMIAAEGQLLVMDRTALHSYLVWRVAEGVLRARIEANRSDPEPAITFAELAYQASHPEHIVAACTRALEVLKTSPDAVIQARMFGSMHRMAHEALEGDPRLDAPTVEALIDLLGEAAATLDQQVAYYMLMGRRREASGDAARALAAYQVILSDPELAQASWRGPHLAVRADLEATRRVRALALAPAAANAMAGLEREAAAAVLALAPDAPAEAIEAVARRYPACSPTAELWRRAAELHLASGHAHRALRAMRAGLEALQQLNRFGEPPSGELVGTLVTVLVEQGRLGEAALMLADALARKPGLELTHGGAPLNAIHLQSDLLARLAARRQLPALGRRVSDKPQVLDGWSICRPAIRSGSPSDPGAVVLAREPSPEYMEIAFMVSGSSELDRRWTQRLAPGSVLARQDFDSLIFVETFEGSRRLVRLDPRNGATLWTTPDFVSMFEALTAGRAPEPPFEAPMDGLVNADDVILAGDEQVIVVVRRSGEVAAIDLGDGSVLWTDRSGVRRVHDVAVGAGMVVVGGAAEGAELAAFDVRTGERAYTARETDGAIPPQLRWIRLTDRGDLIAGTASGALCVSLIHGRVNWSLERPELAGSLDAWVFGDRLLLLGSDRVLYQGSISGGEVLPAPLDTRERLDSTSRIEVYDLLDRLALCTSRGLVVLDANGRCVGADAVDAASALAPAAPGSEGFVSLRRDGSEAGAYRLAMLDSTGRLVGPTRRMLLPGDPQSLILLDGLIVVGCPTATIALSAPPE